MFQSVRALRDGCGVFRLESVGLYQFEHSPYTGMSACRKALCLDSAGFGENRESVFPAGFCRSGYQLPGNTDSLVQKCPWTAFGIAEKLLRSGGFGMLVLDLTESCRIRANTLGRIHNMAQRFGSLVLCLTRKPQGPSVSGSDGFCSCSCGCTQES